MPHAQFLPPVHEQDPLASARAVLSRAEDCPRCARALAQVYEKLGSTLFRDDDPAELMLAYDVEDRNECTEAILAACIAIDGRERVGPTLH